MKKEIVCLKCKKKMKEIDECAFIENEIMCKKCWDKEPFRKLKNIK